MHKSSEAYRRMAAVLDERGIPHHIENPRGRGHPRLVFRYRGRDLFHILCGSRMSDVNAAKIAEADVRRLLAKVDAEMDEQELAGQPAPPTPGLIPFSFEGSDVRLTDRDGCPWFVLADVCRALEHTNPSEAAKRLDADERMTLSTAESHSGQRGGAQSVIVINESGLYSLVLTSRKPAAKRFKKWVTAEVLPSIRRTGAYSVAPAGFTLETLPPAVRKEIGGIVKSVIRAEVGDIRAGVELLLDGYTPGVPPAISMDGYVTSLQVAEMAGATTGRRGRGLTSMISLKLKDFCIEHGHRMGKVETHPGKRVVFARAGAEAWLDAGGRDFIMHRVRIAEAARNGQGNLRLV